VFLNADILFVDNSSIGMEFMSLGRPVVWMNAPWYRRDVHHGGRFWTWAEDALTVDDPQAILATNLWDIDLHRADIVAAQNRHVTATYAYTDGSSGQRAADFIAERFGAQ
jgi:CDP-glycerol glycerophosphotransferase (TagB/SpsB family)